MRRAAPFCHLDPSCALEEAFEEQGRWSLSDRLAAASRFLPGPSGSFRTPDTVELGWSQRGENEPQVGAWKEGLGGREFLAEMNQHGIVGRRAQAMEPHV